MHPGWRRCSSVEHPDMLPHRPGARAVPSAARAVLHAPGPPGGYLQERITTLLGRETSVVVIYGGVGREQRLAVQEAFRHDPHVQVLLATGEGINLQRARLMVNYDLPWNEPAGTALWHPPDRRRAGARRPRASFRVCPRATVVRKHPGDKLIG